MGYCDFVVQDQENDIALGQVIIEHILLNRIRNRKPTIVLLTGESGEGKSYSALKLAEYILKAYNLELKDYLNDIEIFTPLQYRDKMDALLYDKKLKKVKVVILDEAREVISSKDWFSFINRSIADINATFRTIKPMVVLIVTQYTGDVDKSIRRSITYWGKCTRPLGEHARLALYRKWQDEYDIENPKMKKRRVFGYVVKKGRHYKIKPTFIFKLPDKEVRKQYEKLNHTAKSKIIRFKMDALLKMLEKDLKDPIEKVEALANWYSTKPELLPMIVERKRGKIMLKKDFDKMHELTQSEKKEFHERLLAKLVERGLAHGIRKNKSD